MVKGTLVPVGRVFKRFPGSGNYDYFGIDVTDNPFALQHTLRFCAPEGSPSQTVTCRVSTIELNKKRVNVTKIVDGEKNQYAIRANQPLPSEVGEGWEVLVNANESVIAAGMEMEAKARPQPPDKLGLPKKTAHSPNNKPTQPVSRAFGTRARFFIAIDYHNVY